MAVIGAIGITKGYYQLLRLAKYISRNSLPIQLTLIGFSMGDLALKKAGVHITGRYEDESALDILKTVNPDLVFLPSIWPETYSYVLDIAIQFGCPISVFNIGALPERLNQICYPFIIKLQYSIINNPRYIIEELENFQMFNKIDLLKKIN